MPQLDVTKLYPEEVLVAYANSLLAETPFAVYGAVYAQDSHVSLQAQDQNGKNVRLIAPVCEFVPGVIAFKSVLQAKDGKASWLSNGQASEGCKEIAFFGESGPKLVSSTQGLSDYMRSGSAAEYQNPEGYREYMESTLKMQIDKGYYTDTFDVLQGTERRSLETSAPSHMI